MWKWTNIHVIYNDLLAKNLIPLFFIVTHDNAHKVYRQAFPQKNILFQYSNIDPIYYIYLPFANIV